MAGAKLHRTIFVMGQVGCGLLLTGETAKLQNCLTFGGMGDRDGNAP